MDIAHHVALDLDAARIDLRSWLFTLTNEEYRRCCNLRVMKNLALGYYSENGRRGMINVEWLAAAVAVHFFLEQVSEPDRVVMHSGKSRLYLLGCIPVSMSVTRELRIEPVSPGKVILHGKTAIAYRGSLLALLARTPPGTLAAKLYFREELEGFARDILAKCR